MKPARSHDDALLEWLRAGTGGDTEADPRLPLVQALARAASEPPPAAVERRHLAAISEAVVTLGEVGVRSGSNRRPPAAEPGARGLRGLRASRTLKVAALAAATALAIAGLAFASAGLPAPLRTALEEAGLLPEDGADRSRSATRRPAGTALGRGPRSRCAPGRRGFVERDAGLVCAPRPSHGRRAGLSSPARSAGEPQRQTRVEGVPLRSPPRGQTSGRRPRRLVAGGERASGLHEGAQRLGARAQRLLAEPARRLPGRGCPRSLKRRALGWLGAWARERRGPARGTPASETSAPAGAFLASGREPVAAPLKGPVSAEPARLAIHPL